MRSQKEQFLLHRVRRFQDQNAFAELIKPYASGMQRLLRSKLPKAEDAEDAYNSALLRGWSYLTSAVEVENVGGLFHTLTRNVIYDFYRQRKIETVSTISSEGEEREFEDERALRKITSSSEISVLKDAMETLKEEHREIIILRFMEELSAREIGRRMEMTEGAVRMTLHRAVKALREAFEK